MTTWKIKYTTLTQCNLLFDAIRDKDLDKFKKEMVVQDVNYQTPEGWTALMALSRIGRSNVEMEMIELLLQGGADPNLQNSDGRTALHYASRWSGNHSTERTVELLLQGGAEPNIQDSDGWTALHYASRLSRTESTERTVELLLRGGAEPNLRNNNGETALYYASWYSGTDSTERTVELLLRGGANPNTDASTQKIYQTMLIKKARSTIAAKLFMGFHLPLEFYQKLPMIV